MRSFRIDVRWDGGVIGGLALVEPLRTTVDVVSYRQDQRTILNTAGLSHSDTAKFERELSDDLALDLWARGPALRKDVSLTFTDSSDGIVVAYLLRGCWVCGYTVVPRSDGSVIESLTLSVDQWQRVIPDAHLRAERLAAERSATVRRVNIDALVSKYLDQTSAVLDRILTEASRKGDILLLDEADALFGTRTKVVDSHDRYASEQVEALLQRLSAHPGPIVVAEQSPESTRSARFPPT